MPAVWYNQINKQLDSYVSVILEHKSRQTREREEENQVEINLLFEWKTRKKKEHRSTDPVSMSMWSKSFESVQ